MRKINGRTELFIQYFKNGLDVVARNLKYLLKRMNVVIFQLMMKMAIASPIIAALAALTSPRYSGARNRESAPKLFINDPPTVLNNRNQNNNNTWNLFKCNKTSCTGKE